MAELMDMREVRRLVKVYKDWPKPGVDFCDIFSILANPRAYQSVLANMCSFIQKNCKGPIDVVVGLSSRGFLIGPQLAQLLNVPFVPVRKDGELPGGCITDSYEKEYGKSVQAIQVDALMPGARVLLVDDLLATGGSLASAGRLVNRLGGTVAACAVVFSIDKLVEVRRKQIDFQILSLMNF